MSTKQTSVIFVYILLCAVCGGLEAKTFGRCELAQALKNKYSIPSSQLATWVCIAKHESQYNTGAKSNTGDHGIFQINERWWCSNSSKPGKACKTTCARFRDANIGDDVACIKKIYAEHQRISGNGFNAWTTYKFCKGNVGQYTKGCS